MSKKQYDREQFVEDHLNKELDIKNDPMTTWENNYTDRMVSPLMLARYFKLLRVVNSVILVILILLIVSIFGLAIKFLFFQAYEMVLFTDGTELSCLYNPSNGVMIQNDK